MFASHVYSMTLQAMQHRLVGVASEEGQHVSSMHLLSNQWVGLLVLMLVYELVNWKCLSQQK